MPAFVSECKHYDLRFRAEHFSIQFLLLGVFFHSEPYPAISCFTSFIDKKKRRKTRESERVGERGILVEY